MTRLLDLFCGGGGAAMGYSRAGFDEIVGVDIKPQPRYPFHFVEGDALEYLAEHGYKFDAIHASPPCQGYSIMNNLPWLKGRDYPLLILPTMELLEASGKPYVLENVMGARHGAKGLTKRGIESHGLKAGWLCGGMFGLPFYRHRLFASNWFWLAPGHPKHVQRIRPGYLLAGRARDIIFSPKPRGKWEERYSARTGKEWDTEGALKLRPGLEHVPFSQPIINPVNSEWRQYHDGSLAAKQRGNGAQVEGVGVGHAKGWRLAAEAMGIDWMKRDELTQAIPPAYTEYIGRELLRQI
jgi:hypothetical protein